jgi:predicted dehydrogenase
MSPLRTAVIGAGHLGQYHAQKYAAHPEVRLVAVADVNLARAREVAARHGAEALPDWRTLPGKVDAVSIAAPAADHCAIALGCLEAGLHVLVEKPIAVTLAEADRIIAQARESRRVLHVGHSERFNPVGAELLRQVRDPLFIECHRLAPFKPRGTDVTVLLDLMIHDLDLIAALAGAEFTDLDACGVTVLSDSVDIANARVRFANGCTANITSSRVSLKVERKLRVFQRDTYFSADLQKQELTVARKSGAGEQMRIEHEHHHLAGDALAAEVAAFVDAVRGKPSPGVSGAEGRRALQLCLEVGARLAAAGPPAPRVARAH